MRVRQTKSSFGTLFRLPILTCLAVASTLSLSCQSGTVRAGAPASPSQQGTADVAVHVVPVISQKLHMTRALPGELYPYEEVAVYPKVTGFLDWIGVDRGSTVKQGELIAKLEAPELVAQRAEADSRLQSAQSQLAAAEAKLAADQSTYQKLKAASQTPGVVAGNDLILAQKTAQADQAQVAAQTHNVAAANDALSAVTQLENYLKIYAPFNGVVTERDAHPGTLVGPAGGPGGTFPLIRVETLNRLRLVVPVPQDYLAGIWENAQVDFSVPSYPGVVFHAPIARISHSLDIKTRTMPVELDVRNPRDQLDPGTFAQVLWPVERPYATLFVPSSAVTTDSQQTFVIRVRNGKAEWVDVKTGASMGNLVEVFGKLREGDDVVLRATDELRNGTILRTQLGTTRRTD
jgi:membrane fusion protein, multidrug efflux system